MWRKILVVLLACVWGQAQPAAGKRPFTVEQMLRLARISEPVLSPDGLTVAFTVQTIDVEANSKPPIHQRSL